MSRRYDHPYQRLRAKGGHMLRRPPVTHGTAASMSLVGLGIFAARGSPSDCCTPKCFEKATLWAAWLRNGQVAILPFCVVHAKEHLVFDEVEEIDAKYRRRPRPKA